MNLREQLERIKRINALADTGLVYSDQGYDRERYEEIKEIGLHMLADITDQPLGKLKDFYMPVEDYPTPKVDVRGLVLNSENEILMARESEDGKWTIPGGWADVGFTASEVIVKEIEEETGLNVSVDRLLAVYDKKCHPHPPQPFYIYKLVFLCIINDGELKPSFDILDTAFFGMDNLPELSEDRILKPQLQQLFKMAMDKNKVVYFD
ncbi:NUDIX hydrolase [Spongiimicrobium sp. 3-5]|uniref:NUDIX hydrolase n=1 Tax=Spongiimicrobium sp. 3-5 TaxID=3332596 RepID=UPI00397EE4F5